MGKHDWPMPAATTKADGSPRQVGVEFELQGIDIEELARIVADTLNGEIRKNSDVDFRADTADFGEFRIELDYDLLKGMAREQAERDADDVSNLDSLAVELLAAASSLVVPVEVVTPPIAMTKLPAPMEELTKRIRDAGGRGTGTSPFYAFGLHLNVEPPDLDASTIAAYLKAFVCLFDWLTWREQIDLTRRATPYIRRFPREYEMLVSDPDYRPDAERLVDDYLKWNPTRNRAMDMLPILGELEPETIRERVNDDRVKFRPTFHYRLANCNIDEPDWTIEKPWSDWLQIEQLAANPRRLGECCKAYLADRDRLLHRFDNEWRESVTHWLDPQLLA